MKKKRVNKSEERERAFLNILLCQKSTKDLPIVHFQKLKPILQKNTFLLILIL